MGVTFMSKNTLKKELSLAQVIAMAAGGMIAAWMVEIKYWFELSGVGSLAALGLCAILVLFLAEIYSEMTAMLPYAGGSGVWATNAFGWNVGWAANWALLLLYIMAMPTVTYGISSMIGYFYPITFTQTKILAVVITILWFFLTNMEIKFLARIQNVLFWTTLVVCVVADIIFIFSSHWSIKTMMPIFPNGSRGFFLAVGLLIFKFIGFDMVPQLAEEANFPRSKVKYAFIGAIGLTFLVYGMAILGVGGIVSTDWILEVDIVDPRVASLIGMPWLGTLVVVLGIGTCVTTLSGFWLSAARSLYAGARQRQYPLFFEKVNKSGQPSNANIVVGLLALYFTAFAPENWVNYIYVIYGVTAGAVYLSVVLSFIKLRKTQPDWERPHKVKYPAIVSAISLIFILWVFIASFAEMNKGGFVVLLIYVTLGLCFWIYARHKQKTDPENWKPHLINPETEKIHD